MAKINTAERVSREASDNFVFQRSLLAYHAAAERIAGDVLEIGTGSGYGIEVVAPHARRFTTIDKHIPPQELLARTDVAFRQAVVPPLPFADASFDWVITFQVIEHIRRDGEFVREIHRVLRPGGQLIVTTPNAPMSLTRNPWHVREYTAGELRTLLGESFAAVETLGVFGIRPTGLRSFDLTPRLPAKWERMSLRNIRAFGSCFDVEVARADKGLEVRVTAGDRVVCRRTIRDGRTLHVSLD